MNINELIIRRVKNNDLKKIQCLFFSVFNNKVSISYLKNNLNEIKKFFFAGFHLTCLGGKKEFSMLSSKYENSYSDFAAKTILLKKKNKKIYSFKNAGSDERQYNYPGINLPVVTLTRELFGKFKEYHTSADNLKKININELSKSYEYIKNIILFIENNYIKYLILQVLFSVYFLLHPLIYAVYIYKTKKGWLS